MENWESSFWYKGLIADVYAKIDGESQEMMCTLVVNSYTEALDLLVKNSTNILIKYCKNAIFIGIAKNMI